MEFALSSLDLLGIHHLFFSHFFLLEWKSLYFGVTELVWFHRFMAGEEFCLRISHITSLIHMCFR